MSDEGKVHATDAKTIIEAHLHPAQAKAALLLEQFKAGQHPNDLTLEPRMNEAAAVAAALSGLWGEVDQAERRFTRPIPASTANDELIDVVERFCNHRDDAGDAISVLRQKGYLR